MMEKAVQAEGPSMGRGLDPFLDILGTAPAFHHHHLTPILSGEFQRWWCPLVFAEGGFFGKHIGENLARLEMALEHSQQHEISLTLRASL
jgi:hypothetical protein